MTKIANGVESPTYLFESIGNSLYVAKEVMKSDFRIHSFRYELIFSGSQTFFFEQHLTLWISSFPATSCNSQDAVFPSFSSTLGRQKCRLSCGLHHNEKALEV